MDFFAQQDKTRRKTKLLVFYFILAVMFNFAEAPLFQVENAAEREAPKVKFT